VVIELNVKYIVQIITDNVSNYKKAYKMLTCKYHIMWQPCVTHTTNLMFKSIQEFLEYKAMIEVA
jgi:hypothetical protein